MAEPGIRLRISAPTDLFLQGRGFYQLEEDSLYLQLQSPSTDSRFFSYLESDIMRIDLDRSGRMLFLELNAGRHTWPVDERLKLPNSIGYADIRWLDFRRQIPAPSLSTTSDRATLTITFESSPAARSFHLSSSVIIQTTTEDCLHSIIITDIVDDLAGQEIAAFRKELAAKGKPSG